MSVVPTEVSSLDDGKIIFTPVSSSIFFCIDPLQTKKKHSKIIHAVLALSPMNNITHAKQLKRSLPLSFHKAHQRNIYLKQND
jgi:hypothetical protein